MANGEIDSANGTASCQSIKHSSEELEMYYITVCKRIHTKSCKSIDVYNFVVCVLLHSTNLLSCSWYVSTFCFQKMRELILTSSLKVRMEAENDKLTKTLG